MVTRAQARSHLTRKQLERRLASGRLMVARRGVYLFAGASPGPWHELGSAQLAAGPAAVISHRAAAELWELRGFADELPELTVPAPMWPRIEGVRAHQSRRLPGSHVTTRHGMPVTVPARTLADLAAAVTPGFFDCMVDECLRRRLTDLEELRAVHRELVGAVPGLSRLRAALDARRPGYQPGDSNGELELARLLVDAGLPRPVAQYQVVAGRTVYLLDHAYPELRLGYEYDGWGVHGTRSAFDRDRARANALAALGWTLLHFTSGMAPGRLQAEATAAFRRATRDLAPSAGYMREEAGGG
jgi:hypothetical protein